MVFREYGIYKIPSTSDKLLDFESGEHGIWQLISRIDNAHKSKHDQLYIQGLEYIKASIILTCLANLRGQKSFNVLISGNDYTVPEAIRWYLPTLCKSDKCTMFSPCSATLKALTGSDRTFHKKGNDYSRIEHFGGIFERNELICIEFLLENKKCKKIVQMMQSDMLFIESKGRVYEYPKSASAFVVESIIRDYSKAEAFDLWFNIKIPSYNEALYDFPLSYHLDTFSISSPELGRSNYMEDVRGHLETCAKIRVNLDDERITKFINEFVTNNSHICDTKFRDNIRLMLTLSAAICGRSRLQLLDFEFVREICEIIHRPIRFSQLHRKAE